jgi:hypothetical protein
MGCQPFVNRFRLTTDSALVSFDLTHRVPRSRDSDQKEEHMLRSTPYLRFVVLMAVLAALSVMLGSEPWGPW